jgi:hypothetical protein
VLSTRDKTKQIINTISKWTDDFIGTSFKIPSIIELYAHCALGGNKGSGTGMENI